MKLKRYSMANYLGHYGKACLSADVEELEAKCSMLEEENAQLLTALEASEMLMDHWDKAYAAITNAKGEMP